MTAVKAVAVALLTTIEPGVGGGGLVADIAAIAASGRRPTQTIARSIAPAAAGRRPHATLRLR
jgi:hypothetical protein